MGVSNVLFLFVVLLFVVVGLQVAFPGISEGSTEVAAGRSRNATEPHQLRLHPELAGQPAEVVGRERLRDVWQAQWYLQIVGLLLAILLIYLAGLLLRNFFGRQIYRQVERLIEAVPGFKQVYPHVKQVVELVLGEKAMAFSTVVLVEYPSRDIWTIGFLTGDSMKAVDDAAGGVTVSVFIPTSPTPFTGFTINLKREKVRVMDIPVEQALRFVLTAGVLAPDRKEQDVSSKPLELGTVAVIPAGGSDSHDGVDVDGSDSEDGDAG